MNLKLSAGLLFLTALIFSSCSSTVLHKVGQRPNIILIMTDDQGWFDVGFNGNDELFTPNIDLMASKGIIFDRFYSASAVCSPTRASLITGRNPLRMNIPYANDGHLNEEEITLPEILKKAGYSTGHFGKWHLGTLTRTERDANRGGKPEFEDEYSIPSQHGYDYYFCTESKVPTYDPMVFPSEYEEGESKRFGWKAVTQMDSTRAYGTAYWVGEGKKETTNLQGNNSRIITDRVIPFIEESVQQARPFFSTIWFHTPHLPVVADSQHRNLYKELDFETGLYYGAITAMDEQIGRIWKKLEDLGIRDNTIIFFCSDNGPERSTPGSAGIFRARKRSLYEGGVRVPAFAVWESHLDEGIRLDFPAVTSDYLPTILDLLDIEYPDDRSIDGVSILNAIQEGIQQRNKPIGFICRPQVSWVNQQYKLIGDEDMENLELYDIFNDRSEENDVIEEFPEIAMKMKAELVAWLNSVENSKKGMDY